MANKKMNIYEKIMSARLQFLQSNPQKSGYNKFQNFKYFELVDIVPVATKICCELGLYTHINIEDSQAVMLVLNVDDPSEIVEYRLTSPVVQQDKFNNMLQDVGRCETYIRRYLYMLFLDITENDTVDGADQKTFKSANNLKRGKSKAPFKTANNVKVTDKSSARIVAEKIIKGMNNPTLLDAKVELAKICKEGDMDADECDEILKCLKILLNGTNSSM